MAAFGESIRKLGFGLMRLPQKDGAIDLEQTKEMVDLFLGAGCTYFDTAWAYAGSEDAIRQALVERYPRESFLLATKNAAWIDCKTKEDAWAQFDVSLERTGAGYFDFYLLHNLGEARTRYFDEFGLWDWVQGKKEAGLIRHAGFSFHSTPEELDALLDAHPEMEFVQLQINYADWENPAVQSRACYEVARKHGKPVIVMEPVKGGMLASPPENVAGLFRQAEPGASAASWALRFAADLEGVLVVLSGMGSVAQMEDNLSYLAGFEGLTEAQRGTLARAREEIARVPLIPCTACEYCAKVCPKNIGVSGSFTAMNTFSLFHDLAAARDQLKRRVEGRGKVSASECIQCGKCEAACPQHIGIREQLKAVCRELM